MPKTSVPAFTLMLLACALILASCSLQLTQQITSTSPSVQRGTAEWRARQMFLLLKQENPRLAWNQCLAEAACIRAKHLASTNSFSHRDPVSGKNPAFDMIKSNCSEFRVIGENFARGSDDPKELHRALMESPSHRSNIMDPQYELVGVGCCEDYCVELFAGL